MSASHANTPGSEAFSDEWMTLQVLLPHWQAVLHLAGRWFVKLPTGEAWFYVPLVESADPPHGILLELAAPNARSNNLWQILMEMLGNAAARGEVSSMWRADTSAVLNPALYPAETLLPSYTRLLSLGSARACRLIATTLAAESDGHVGASAARHELITTYRELIAESVFRATLLHHHADWLRSVVGRTTRTRRAAQIENSSKEVAAIELPSYAGLGQTLAAEALDLSAEHHTEALHAAVARAVHIQMIRLLGPGREGLLEWEAEVVSAAAEDAAREASNHP